MDTTLTHSYSISSSLAQNDGNNTTRMVTSSQSRNLNTIAIPVLMAGLLLSPAPIVPTKATRDYLIYPHYAAIGQQNEIEFENSVADIINSYQSYPTNWDGYNGVPPSDEAINDALAFIDNLPYGTREPRPGLSGDGEISLFWETGDVFVDIGFVGGEKYSFYARDNQNIEYFRDEVEISEPIPKALINLIEIA